MAICHTRKLKLAQAFKPTAALSVRRIHFAMVTFHTPSGAFVQPLADVQTAQLYLYDAIGAINSYCSQYGVPAAAVDMNALYSFEVSLTGTTFTDADVQTWVDQMAAKAGWGTTDSVVIISPQGVVNTDAPVSSGVIGYHGAANITYSFVNALNTGWNVADWTGGFCYGLSHEIEEMVCDPMADAQNLEVSDPCSGNCGIFYPNYFDSNYQWMPASLTPELLGTYLFYISGVAKPANVGQCPPAQTACTYAPPTAISPPPSPPPMSLASKTCSGAVSAQAAAGETVTIVVTQPDGTTVGLTATTDGSGNYTTTFTPTQTGSHSADAFIAADAVYASADSGAIPFTVTAPLQPRTISLSVN